MRGDAALWGSRPALRKGEMDGGAAERAGKIPFALRYIYPVLSCIPVGD